MPWDFAALTPRKKAALIGMIQMRVEAEKTATAKNKAKGRRK